MKSIRPGARMRGPLHGASWVILAWAIGGPALAQNGAASATQRLPDVAEPPPPSALPAAATAPVAGLQTFDPNYFKTYNPVTAADMVARVPGFELREGDDRRGFGATAGNILVNGERPSSKAVLADQLKRIPAEMVTRLELISGAASSEASGQSQLVNVVLRKAAARNSPTTYVLGARGLQYAGRIAWTAQASRTLALGDHTELALDLQAPNLLGRGQNSDVLRNGAGVVTGSRLVNSQADNRGLQGAANLRWRPRPSDSVNLNLQYAPTWNTSVTDSTEFTTAGVVRTSLTGGSRFDNNYIGELGADWEHRFSPTFSTKLISLVTQNSVDQTDIYQTYTAPASFGTRTQGRSTEGGERVGRFTGTWRAAKVHTLEFGGEGAFNYRQTALDIFVQPQGGVKTSVPLAVSHARVEELRGEVFAADVWTLNPTLTLEGRFTFEASRISQTGDQIQERQFSYPKPRVTAAWTINPTNQVRASVERDVAQLDFAEFSSTVDFVNAASIQGNPDLQPEKAWKSRVEWQGRFGKRGALTLAAFYDTVEDVHDLVDIAGADAYGNIGDGTRRGVEIKATVPLAFMGLPTAELRFNGLVQQTEVVDPKTGLTRSFSVSPERQGSAPGSPTLNAGNKDWAYVITYRQEMPRLNSAWGANIVQWAGRAEYKRAELVTYRRETPRLDLYWETTAIKSVTLRFIANNILSPSENRVRNFYVGDRASGIIARTESRTAQGGPEGTRSIGVQLSGKF